MTLDENLPAENFQETLGQYMKGQTEIENKRNCQYRMAKHYIMTEKYAEIMGLAATAYPFHHLTPSRKSQTGCDIIRKGPVLSKRSQSGR